MGNIIQLNNVNKWYGDFHVLKDINFEVSEKEKVAYNIAVNFLETSFDLERSLGFVNYIKKHYLREDS